MKAMISVLRTVAAELAYKAKSQLPELKEGEEIKKEWFDSGIFYRETTQGLYQYRFKPSKPSG